MTVPLPPPPFVSTVNVSLSRATPPSDAVVVPPTAACACSVDDFDPKVIGPNVTVIVHEAPAPRVCPEHVSVAIAKSSAFDSAMAIVELAWPPLLVSMYVTGALVVITSWLP